jgi:ABC-2 type transport system ATP-binding protein
VSSPSGGERGRGYAIELQGVSKHFGLKVAVDNVGFVVHPGTCYGLIGPNGAGKTTTFSMLCGFLYPTRGVIKVLDAVPTAPGALKGKVGVLPQDAVLPPTWPVGTLLTYLARLSGLPNPEKEAREAIERVGLPETWGVHCGALSHGMHKRIAMAQALMGQPPVILLDEPTAGLDPKIAAHVRNIIRELKGKSTVVVSSHNLNELEELCDATAVLDKGALVTSGSMAELTGQSAEFRVQLAKGTVALEKVRGLSGVTSATLDAQNVLVVVFDGKTAQVEDVISAALGVVLADGAKVVGVWRGKKLEEKVLQLT